MTSSNLLTSLLAQYQSDFEKIVLMVESASESQMAAKADGEWSAAFILHHLADADVHFHARYLFCLTETNPTISPFDEELYEAGTKYADRNYKASLGAIKGLNPLTTNLLSVAIEESFNRISTHPVAGEMTLLDIFTMGANHRHGHVEQLEKTLWK